MYKLWSSLLGLILTSSAINAGAQGINYSVSNLWSISTTNGRPYLTNSSASSYTERGVAYSPENNHAYIVSRAGTLRVAILNGDTGAEVGFLNVSGIAQGTFILSTLAVAEDGAIYGANLTTSSSGSTTPYKLYRWASEGSAPVNIYSGNPSAPNTAIRWGDCALDVRGSGINTEIIAGANGLGMAAIFKPTDASLATFTSTRIDVSGIGVSDLTRGIAWGPTNTFYGKNNGTPIRFCTYNLAAGTGTVLASYPAPGIPTGVAPIDVDPVRNLLAAVESANALSPHNLLVYDLSSGSPSQIFTTPFPPPAANNGNIVGEVQIAGDRIFAVDAQNGVLMAKIYASTAALPPAISQQIGSNTVVEGGYIKLSMSATGTKPLNYQWYHEGVLIDGANTNYLNLTNISITATGRYSVTVSNEAGTTNTQPGFLTVSPSYRSPVMAPLWNLEPGSRPWLTTDNNQRGIAFNAFTGHLLVVSRAPTTAIYILDAATGADVGTLNVDPSIIKGGTFTINLIGVADDRSIYAANLTTGAAADHFRVYRWAYEDSSLAPTLAYDGDPTGAGGTSVRWGDDMDVRGYAPVQILVGSRAGSKAAVLSSPDGTTLFTSTPITTDAPDGSLGLGIAFGAGDTFWARATATALRNIGFDPVTGSSTTLHTYGPSVFPGNIGPIAVDVTKNYLAGISIETPDNVRLFNIAELSQPPLELDTKFFPTDNANANGTGSADFGPEHLFTLDSNNGIMAFLLQGPPTITCAPAKVVECGTAWTFDEPTTTDFCDAQIPVIIASTTTNKLCGNTFTATRVWMATNTCGNRAQCAQTVTVQDTTPPTLVCQPNKTVECGTSWTFDAPLPTDACGTATNHIVSTVTNGVVGNSFTATRTWTATDACGNVSLACSQTVTVQDTIAPVITVLGANPMTIELHGTYVEPGATAADACAGNLTLQIAVSDNVNVNQAGTYTVRYNVSDPNGNAAVEATRTVNVVDSSAAPTITIEVQGNQILISWPDSGTYILQETSDLTAPVSWGPSSATISTSGGRKIATTTNEGGIKFFRLRSAP